jgi:hypothetical protein
LNRFEESEEEKEMIDEKSKQEHARLAAIEWVRRNSDSDKLLTKGRDYINAFLAGVAWKEKQEQPVESQERNNDLA